MDVTVFKTNAVFMLNPISMNRSDNVRLTLDFHLAQGIPTLSPPAGIVDLSSAGIPSIDMNSAEMLPNGYALSGRISDFRGRVLHSDVKDVAYFFTHAIFDRIVKEGRLK